MVNQTSVGRYSKRATSSQDAYGPQKAESTAISVAVGMVSIFDLMGMSGGS